jgi:TolB-like protein/regulator of sirC expression with transglutaminase-like and TPR domain
MTRAVLVVLLLGFPVAMVLAWAFDLGSGLQLIPDAGPQAGSSERLDGKLPLIAAVALLVGAGVGAFFALGGLEEPRAVGKSIAVLPFQNLGGRTEDAYLADGLQEEILNALARLRDLKVISRSSVMEYRDKAHNVREIAERLDVATVLEGSVRRDGERLRLTVQLIDARTDKHLLAANYDRELDQVLDLQSSVARLVAEALAATLSSYERGELERVATNSGDAYDRYLRALAAFQRRAQNEGEGLIEPRRLLQEALGFDADYADALALLSRVATWNWFVRGNRDEDAATARSAFERALSLDPGLPEAVLARGLYSMYIARDPERAIGDFTAVLEHRPNNAEAHNLLGYALRRKSRFEEALGHFTTAWDLDPLNQSFADAPLMTLLGLRRFPEAIAQTELQTKRFPDSPDSYLVRARLQGFRQKSVEPLREALQRVDAMLDANERTVYAAELAQREGRYQDAITLWAGLPTRDPFARNLGVGWRYDMAGDREKANHYYRQALEAAAAVQRDPAQLDLEFVAVAESLLGAHDAALATIEKVAQFNPESTDAINGPWVSFVRSIILVRAGRVEEGHAEAARLLRVPFAAPVQHFFGPSLDFVLRRAIQDDRQFDAFFDDPPRL